MLAALVLAAATAVPQIVVTTGRVTDGQDRPIAGLQELTFGLFTNAVKPETPDTPVWTETYKTLVDQSGLYAVRLGYAVDDSGASGKKAFDADTWAGGDVFLEIAVNGETLSPRVRIGSAPFALTAGTALTLGGQAPAYYATAASDAAKLALAGGALTGALTGTAATFSGAVAAQAFAGDGSALTSVSGTDATKLALAGGTLTGALSGTAATFSGTVAAQRFSGDGSMLANVSGTDATKLPLAGGTLTGALTGTAATFSGTVTAQKFSGDGSLLTSVTGTDATKLPLAGGTLTGALKGSAATFTGTVTAGRLVVGDSAPISQNLNDGVGTPEYPYAYSFTVTGDPYTFYPVAFASAGNGIPQGKIVIARSYSEAGPTAPAPDSSHIAGLQAVFTTNNLAWADYNYMTLTSYHWTYVRTVADCGNLPYASSGLTVWCRLRGGGYVYHVWSNYPTTPAIPSPGSVAYSSSPSTFTYPGTLAASALANNAFAPSATIVPVAAY